MRRAAVRACVGGLTSAVLCAAAGVCVCGGCVSRVPVAGPGPRVIEPGEPGGPFAPTVARVHPLTHAERDASGAAVVVAHVEFLDRWGDAVKAAGVARFALWETAGRDDAGTVRWFVDLTDLALNASHYDPVTRTYRFELEGAPEAALARGATLGVAFDGVGAGGSVYVLRDRAALLGP